MPDVTDDGLPMTTEDGNSSNDVTPTTDAASTGWAASPSEEYEIERVVSATRVGGGWRLNVKWKGFQDTTPETLSYLLTQTQHPDILKEIEQCQQDWYAQNPNALRADEEDKLPADVPAPTRVQPGRAGRIKKYTKFAVTMDSPHLPEAFRWFARHLRSCNAARLSVGPSL